MSDFKKEKSIEKIQLNHIIANHHEEIEEILEQDNPQPVFEDYDDFKVLVVRKMKIDKKDLKFNSEIFILSEKKTYIYIKEGHTFEILKHGNLSIFERLETMLFNNLQILNIYINEIESLEESLFNRKPAPYFMDLWFDSKKDLSKAENYYYRTGLVFREFIKKSTQYIDDLSDEYNDLEDSIRFQTSSINALEERLKGLHSYYESIKNDRLNSTLLLLTLISGVFLPLNLIVGFFGMNTPGLFFNKDPQGTMNVVWILVGVIIVCLAGMNILKIVNTYFLKHFVGRNKFYNRIYKKLEKIDSQLKGR